MLPEMMSIVEFNKKYSRRNLRVKTINSSGLWDEFTNHFPGDYRTSQLDNLQKGVASSLQPIEFNNQLITSEVIGLFQNSTPVGVATLIIEPKSSLQIKKGLIQEKEKFRVVKLEEVVNHIPDFVITRGWRTINIELRKQGIGADLRKLITSRIYEVLAQSSNLSIGFLGMVASGLTKEEKLAIASFMESKTTGEKIDFQSIPVNINKFGKPTTESRPAFNGYVNDGYTLIENSYFPVSYGALFYRNNSS